MQLHEHHKQALCLFCLVSSSNTPPPHPHNLEVPVSICVRAYGAVINVRVLLCQFVIVYMGLTCVLMYIGND